MIQSAFYNGINFSGDFARKNKLIDYRLQRKTSFINRDKDKNLRFFCSGAYEYAILYVCGSDTNFYPMLFAPDDPVAFNGGYTFNINISSGTLGNLNENIFFKLECNGEFIFSEFCTLQDNAFFNENNIIEVTATNNNNRHGFLTIPAFGNYEAVGFNEDFFINDKTEYKYSYGRSLILSSENNIGRRITFKNLNMYHQNQLKTLCNCENLFLNGVKYKLISEFSELLNDNNSEIKDLQADFVLADQSFFRDGSSEPPINVFEKYFFM